MSSNDPLWQEILDALKAGGESYDFDVIDAASSVQKLFVREFAARDREIERLRGALQEIIQSWDEWGDGVMSLDIAEQALSPPPA